MSEPISVRIRKYLNESFPFRNFGYYDHDQLNTILYHRELKRFCVVQLKLKEKSLQIDLQKEKEIIAETFEESDLKSDEAISKWLIINLKKIFKMKCKKSPDFRPHYMVYAHDCYCFRNNSPHGKID